MYLHGSKYIAFEYLAENCIYNVVNMRQCCMVHSISCHVSEVIFINYGCKVTTHRIWRRNAFLISIT